MPATQVITHVFVFALARVCAEIWPPFGHLTPNNYIPPPVCTYQQEKVYEDILEEVCTTEDVQNCSVQVVSEETEVTETVCEDIVENICDEAECETDPDNCEHCDDDHPSCQEVFKNESKTVCSYETKMDKKCFRMYEVSYVDDCERVVHTKCKLFHNFLCDRVNSTRCTKVPVFPSSSCREVPRLQEVCRQVAVRRPVARCRQVQCQEPRCREVATQQCSQRTSLKPVPSNQTVCATVPSKTCKTEKVKRLKLIPKKICTELKPTEEPKDP